MVILPSTHHRLQQVEDIWSVKQCPHCDKVWQRDVNACKYLISYLLTLILLIYFSVPNFGSNQRKVKNSQVVLTATFNLLCLFSAASAKLMAEAIMLPDVNTTIGKTITGKVSFAQESPVDKVQITFSFKGLLPDTTHGIHIHGAPIKNQNCSNAGGHFNPLNTTHGDRLSSRENRHVGDLEILLRMPRARLK